MHNPDTSQVTAQSPVPASQRTVSAQLKRLATAVGILVLCFSQALYQWLQFGLHSELYSYTLLIPVISGYLLWTQRDRICLSSPATFLATGLSTATVLLLGVYWFFIRTKSGLLENDRLFLILLCFVLLALAGAGLFLGARGIRTALFPLLFLFFMAPLPSAVENGLEAFLQHRSADAAYWMLKISGMPIFREGTRLTMPTLILEVAPECSGIRSSIVLFLTSLLAGHFFLRNRLNKALLAGSVIALGVLRNGFRIFTLAQLTVNVDPAIIDSPLHHRGGPIFFALSLIPFFLLLWYLRRTERRSKMAQSRQE